MHKGPALGIWRHLPRRRILQALNDRRLPRPIVPHDDGEGRVELDDVLGVWAERSDTHNLQLLYRRHLLNGSRGRFETGGGKGSDFGLIPGRGDFGKWMCQKRVFHHQVMHSTNPSVL